MKKQMMVLTATFMLCAVEINLAKAQTIGQNVKALGSQIADSIESKTPVIAEKVLDKSIEIKDSVVSKAPVIWDSIKSKTSHVGDKAIIVADSVFTKGKRWVDKRKEK